ncbi:MAG: DUF805 domain-containing protein [Patescibacteria group bacterium]
MDRRSLEPGLMLFIKRKLENSVPLREITEMLLRAGFSEKQIKEAVREVYNKFPDTHQDVVASNSFLPPLIEKVKIEEIRRTPTTTMYPSVEKKGLFSGRLRRRDFILGFLLFFAEGMILLSVIMEILNFIIPEFSSFTREIILPEHNGIWLLLIPLILSPISIILLSLIARRLHDLSLPGGIAFAFLVFFVNPMNGVISMYGVVALQVMMAIIFVMLLAVKGDTKNNKHGTPPPIKGPSFARIINI